MITRPDGLVCWKCGASVNEVPYPIGRTAVCPICDADLHVCKLCEFYDTHVSNQCREPIADQVKEKERANFCDYFKAKPNAYVAKENDNAATARAQLEALFGNTSDDAEISATSTPSAEEIARQQLEDLFKK